MKVPQWNLSLHMFTLNFQFKKKMHTLFISIPSLLLLRSVQTLSFSAGIPSFLSQEPVIPTSKFISSHSMCSSVLHFWSHGVHLVDRASGYTTTYRDVDSFSEAAPLKKTVFPSPSSHQFPAAPQLGWGFVTTSPSTMICCRSRTHSHSCGKFM